jgi:polyisoprenoid-binding protein YceI
MRYFSKASLLLSLALIVYGCSSNPAENKPQANVAAPQAETAPAGAAESLKITPENSKVEFVASKVTRSHNGSFKQFAGTIDLVPNSIENSKVNIEIDTNSVVTDDPGLTKHLLTPDFFDVAKYPKATFASTKIEAGNANNATHTVTGNFELHGVKKSISFPATIAVTSADAAVSTEFAINRKDFGIVYPGKTDDLIRDGVVIHLTLRVLRAQK